MDPEAMTNEYLLTCFLVEAHENGFQSALRDESDAHYAARMKRYDALKAELARRLANTRGSETRKGESE